MAKYSNTKAKINEKITTNSAQAITGNVLNEVLQTMVDSLGADYQFGGLVQPGSAFTAGEQPVVFLATTPGTYTNFGGLVVADGEVALLVWSGTAWSKQTPDIATRTEVSQLGQQLHEVKGFDSIAGMPLKIRHLVNTTEESPIGNRYTCICPVKKGATINVSSSFGAGTYVAVFDTIQKAIFGSNNYLQNFGIYGYDFNDKSGTINFDGYLAITTKKLDDSALSDADIAEFLSVTSAYYSGYFVSDSPTLIGTDWYGAKPNIDTVNHTIDFGGSSNGIIIVHGQKSYSISSAIGKIDFFIPSAFSVKLVFNTDTKLISAFSWNDTLSNNQIVLGVIRYLKNGTTYEKFIAATMCCEYTLDYNNPEKRKDLLYIGDVAQQGYNATGLIDGENLKRVAMVDAVAIPFIGCTLKFHLPKDVCLGIRHGNRGADLQNHDYYFYDGDMFTFPNGSIYYRICFVDGYDESRDIYVEKIVGYIEGGTIQIEIINNENGCVVCRNDVQEKKLKALMFNNAYYRVGDLLHTHPVIVHATDVHGDYYRIRNVYEYAKSIKADAILVTGDICAYQPSDGQRFLETLNDEFSIPTVVCVGNHDTSYLTTDEQIYNQVVKHFAEKYGITGGKSYYYQDMPGIGMRFISLNIYDGGHPGTQEYCNIFRTQMEWFISTLQSTPENYGVMVLMHSPETDIVASSQADTSFIQERIIYNHLHDGMTGTPLKDIISAFVNRGNATITYKNYSESDPISINVNFANVANGVEFIAFVSGHQHADRCGYNDGTEQPHLNNVNTIAAYGQPAYPYFSNLSDLPRGTDGVTQDCFNVYVIDKSNKNIKVIKIGSTLKTDFTERSHTVIPY